ncbi:MAG: metallophosphoesterase [Ancrocorticia sp.]
MAASVVCAALVIAPTAVADQHGSAVNSIQPASNVASGWVKSGGSWYYMDESGAKSTGWLLDRGTWYYFGSDGAMRTGWVVDRGTWYYLSDSGAMRTGWLLDRGAWYYLGSNGGMRTGWLLDRGTWYYFSGNGAMVTGKHTVDGKLSNFDANGAWLGYVVEEPPAENPIDKPKLAPRDADGKFSLAIYPDTQKEVYAYINSLFVDRSNWVVSQKDALDIRGVLHIGDVVNWDDAPIRNPWTTEDHPQYEYAVEGLNPLRAAGIPTSLSIGNHDTMATGGGNGGAARDPRYTYAYQRMTDSFNYYLDDAERIPTWKAFENGKVDNGYWTFEAAGARWLVLNLELWPRASVVNWAKGVIASNGDKNVVIQTHNVFNGSCNIDSAGQDVGQWQYGDSSPQRVWNQLVEPYSNVKVVTSGHTGYQCAKVFTTSAGNKVIGTLQNNANGKEHNPVRILEIDVNNGRATTWNHATRNNFTGDRVELAGLNFIR